ncbi:MAG: hypothetical protein J0626_05425, partial [Rhodospirillaceae bacterium]|nr:hypothetical protein [Rhodospirillaceae bacterium]
NNDLAGTNAALLDAQLGTLADNGGFTKSVKLLTGSPAIDAGDGALCPATDQRDMARPQGSNCDIGAYELVYGGAVLASSLNPAR